MDIMDTTLIEGIGEDWHYANGIEFTIKGLNKIATNSGKLTTAHSWMEGESAYAVVLRTDSDKLHSVVMFDKKAEALGFSMTKLSKPFHDSFLRCLALKMALTQAFEVEIE
jgi:hypothetical protein